jgi:sulfite exporter TauE/SafE/copper chaperone CopZ
MTQKHIYYVKGMHCASCEVLIEEKFRKVPGVEKVRVSCRNGKAELYCSRDPDVQELDNAVQPNGYRVSLWQNRNLAEYSKKGKSAVKDYLQTGGIFLAIISAYYILKELDLVPAVDIAQPMSYGIVFLIGLFAAVSTCLAVVGGLLLAVAQKFNEANPGLSGIQKFKPHIYFNIGRILGYTGFGAAVAGIGSGLMLPPQFSGYLTILIGAIMLFLGLQMLNWFPGLGRFSPKVPKFISRKIYNLSEKRDRGAPFMLGAFTFFLPCGFTQALQLYVFASGDWKIGALTMLIFSLGTLPALVSLGAATSFIKGAVQGHFLRFAGALVVLLAIFNINNGLTLAGARLNLVSILQFNNEAAEANIPAIAPIQNGRQIARMTVNGYDYYPSRFTVIQGVPVEWQIDARQAVGCGRVLVMPTLGITEYLPPQGITTIRFIPRETGEIPFNCSMGMMSRDAAFMVMPNTAEIAGAKIFAEENLSECNPEIASCLPVQEALIEVSRERGIYPNIITVQKGIPVNITINSEIQLGGCLSVWVIPKYNKAIPINVGVNQVRFTPSQTGIIDIVCGMGGLMAQIYVIN